MTEQTDQTRTLGLIIAELLDRLGQDSVSWSADQWAEAVRRFASRGGIETSTDPDTGLYSVRVRRNGTAPLIGQIVVPEATILVHRSSSECSRCGKEVHNQETHHTRRAGYAAAHDPRPGCGALFTAISAAWTLQPSQEDRDTLHSIRPDLPQVQYSTVPNERIST